MTATILPLQEEVLNDVMLVIWQSAARFDNTSRLSTWIFDIAYHRALKALARSPKQTADTLPVTAAWSDREGPEGAMTRQELGRTLARALDVLKRGECL